MYSPFRSVLCALMMAAPIAVLGQSSALTAHDAWLREPMGGRNVTGAFVVVENPGDTARAIVSATADISDKVELHEMKNDGGMMRMSPVERIAVPARGKAELKPGSFHLMLFDLKKKTAPGDTVMLTLTFDDGSTVSTEATVRKADGQ